MQNVDRENSNKIKQEEGALSVARVKAQVQNVSHSTTFCTCTRTNR